MSIRYLHLRMHKTAPGFFELNDMAAKGGVTVAYGGLWQEATGRSGRCYTFSVCSPKDGYDRAKGRIQAANNGLDMVIFRVYATPDNDLLRSEDARQGILDDLFQRAGINKRHYFASELNSRDLKKLKRLLGVEKGTL